jgi:hypothetical protein
MAFGRKERLEDTFDVPRIDSGSGVFHPHPHTVRVNFGLHSQHPRAIHDRTHGFGSIHNQVQDDLLQLDSVGKD